MHYDVFYIAFTFCKHGYFFKLLSASVFFSTTCLNSVRIYRLRLLICSCWASYLRLNQYIAQHKMKMLNPCCLMYSNMLSNFICFVLSPSLYGWCLLPHHPLQFRKRLSKQQLAQLRTHQFQHYIVYGHRHALRHCTHHHSIAGFVLGRKT